MKKWWISCKKFTVKVSTNEQSIILDAAPHVRVFVGQPLHNLIRWTQKFGDVRVVRLGP